MEASVASVRGGEVGVIGQKLLEILAGRGWSLNKLASKSGVSVSQLSLLTNGKISYPRANTIQMLCSALGIAESVLLGSQPRQPDLRGAEGATTVPFMRLGSDGDLEETGETCVVALAQLDGRRRLLAAVVEGGGMAPHVLTGDRVLFDPDADPEPEQIVLVSYRKTTRVAWIVDRDQLYEYFVENEKVFLQRDEVRRLGELVYIMRSPPSFRAP